METFTYTQILCVWSEGYNTFYNLILTSAQIKLSVYMNETGKADWSGRKIREIREIRHLFHLPQKARWSKRMGCARGLEYLRMVSQKMEEEIFNRKSEMSKITFLFHSGKLLASFD